MKSKAGPLKVLTKNGSSVTIYSAGSGKVMVCWYEKGIREQAKCKSLEKGIERAKWKLEELISGKSKEFTLSEKDYRDIQHCVEILGPLNLKLSQAVTGYVECRRILPEMEPADAIRQYSSYLAEQKKRQNLKIIPFDRLVREFLDNASVERKSARYINDMRARLLQAAKAFTGNVGDIEADAINAWLKGLTIQPRSKREKAALKGRSQKLPKPTPRTINNYRTALCTLFSYARAEGYLPRDKKSEAEHSRRLTDKGSKILFYTPEQLSILINNVPKPLVPFIALGGFAGLRTAEIVRLEWADIWFEKGWIEVGKHKAKTATRRLVPILPVLVAWLKPLAKKSGRVLDVVRDDVHLSKLMRDAVSKIVDSTGKSLVKTVHNGLRHSWVSYRVAETNNVNQVALEAGNSPKMIFQNYRELVTPAEAKSWFNILPSKPAKK